MITPTPKKEAPDFEAEISGRPIVKKNTQRIIRRGGKTFAIYSKQYLAYRTRALSVFNETKTRRFSTLTGELHASYEFHFKNKQGEADVSNLIEGGQDCLAESLIIENDKQIVSLDAQKIFSGLEKTIIKLWRL